ncbi:hypothetical protein [Zobellia roscoffensis]|uniref:hypothetical protein n=1 Tax=Zobellia roscoffensis TaxID=2779508 RepID=UPI00188BCEE3|nr:hypothetical protein [Zobellia roscoffensis]
MKGKILLVLVMCAISSYGQETKLDQASCLKRYVGEWFSTASAEYNPVGDRSEIKMVNVPKMNGNSIQVEVFQLGNEGYVPILVELISYDAITNKIVALGQNENEVCFSGVGSFSDKNNWIMVDYDFSGNHQQTVSFQFRSDREVYLGGKNNSGEILWKTRYIKK